jgi:predicted GIY-YIG superfamily endonuclease
MGKIAATKARIPLTLIFFEGYLNKYDALRRESYFKTSKGKKSLNVMLWEYFGKRVNFN